MQLTTATKYLKSPLKWAGGKSSIIEKVKAIYDNHRDRTWVDLFAGSCALPLAIQPESVVINDINTDLIDFWKWVARNGSIGYPLVNDPFIYYAVRSRFNKLRSPEDFYYLNQTGFNGLCRYSRFNTFNVPYGGWYKDKVRKINYQYDFTKYKEIVKDWNILNLSYKSIFQTIYKLSSDFIFADPPYDDGFVNYSSNGFGWEEQVLLANLLAESNATVIATNKATPRIINLYESLGFNIEIIPVSRSISCNGDRTKVNEMFATRNV